ncbi:KH domain protein [Streptococcus pyogenes GA40634]|nr:KH domain protein [Streptococcus pyogenes GA40634]
MDTIENLIIAIVKPLISQPDNLTIKIEDTPDFLEYHLDLDAQDIGRVIGKKRSNYYCDKIDCLLGSNTRKKSSLSY